MVIVGIAILLQLGAATLALQLLRLTGWVSAWACLSLALVLMNLRLGLAFQKSRVEIMTPMEEAEQGVALLISLLMLTAVARLIPQIQRWRQAETALEAQVIQRTAALAEANQALQAEVQEHQRTEAALRESEQRYRMLFETMAQGVVYQNAAGQITTANPAAERILGLSLAQLQGRTSHDPCWQARHEDGRAFPGDTHPSMVALATGRAVRNVVMEVFNSREQTYRCLLIHAIPQFRAGESRPFEAYTTFENITERREAEKALRASEARFRALVEASAQIVWTTDAQGRAVEDSPSWRAFTGQPHEAAQGHGWMDAIHPEARTAVEQHWRHSIATATPVEAELRLHHAPSGQYHWMAVRAVPLWDEAGTLCGWVGMYTDIHERKQAEAALQESETRFRQLVEHLREVFWMSNLEGSEMLYVSPTYEALCGRSCQSLYDHPSEWVEAIHPEDAPRVADIHDRIAANGSVDTEYRVRHADGSWRWVRSQAFAVPNSAGEVYRLAGLIEDITQRKAAEAEHQRQQAALAHQARLSLVGEMASGLVHELNQPLTTVGLYAEVCDMALTDTPPNLEALRSALPGIITQSARAEAIIQRVKRFTGQAPPQRQVLDINALVEETSDFVIFDIRRSEAILHLDPGGDVPPVWADPLQVQQVLVNLLRNALEALREGPAPVREVTVRTRRSAASPYVEISVSDTGPGLSPEACEQLFQPFFTTKAEGTGLGLSISRSLVEAHDGRLWVTSTPGQGATFHFTLPIQPDRVDPENRLAEKP